MEIEKEGKEVEVKGEEEREGEPELLEEEDERGEKVTGEEAGGDEAGGEIALSQQHRQAEQRLGSGQEHATLCKGVLVVQRDIRQHPVSSLSRHQIGKQC